MQSIRHIPFRGVQSFDEQTYKALVDLYGDLANNLLKRLDDKEWSTAGFNVQTIIITNNSRDADVLHSYLLDEGQAFKRRLFMFVSDGNHHHVIHDCPFSSGQCKCKWKKNIPIGNPLPGYGDPKLFTRWDFTDFAYNIAYFIYNKPGRKEVYFKGECQRIEVHLKSVQWEHVEGLCGSLLGAYYAQYRHDGDGRLGDREDVGPVSKRSRKRAGWEGSGAVSHQSKWQAIQTRVFKLLESTAICPLEGIKNEQCFLEDDYLTDPDNSVRVNKKKRSNLSHLSLTFNLSLEKNGQTRNSF